jgi:hypothetical protein
MRVISYIVFLLILAPLANGQFFDKERWDERRHQLEMGLGISNFLGDLGGKDAIGTDDLKDLEKTEFHFGGYIGYKYTLYRKLYLRANFSYARVTGDDKLTAEDFRNNRNLNFRSNIFELAAMLEYEIPINLRKGHIYDIKGLKPWKDGRSSFFLFAGVGGFYFNPKSYLDGEWIELQPLRTEGQGLPGGPDVYRRVSMSLPVGAAITKRLATNFSMGFEVTYRYTFTDYIDDVSTVYFNPDDVALYNQDGVGDVAAYLSNPALGVSQGGLPNYVTSPGQQRGDETDDDGFMLLTVKMQYLLGDDGYRGARKTKFKRAKVRRNKRIVF